jgi:membrane fusion protein (multidrug efflux system)
MEDDSGTSERRGAQLRPFLGWFTAVIVVVGASSAIVIARTSSVSKERTQLAADAGRGPRVLVESAQVGRAERQVSFPATIVGYSQTPVFAKIPGYLKEIGVDKGDQVRQGQVLAILTSPEIDEQTADARHSLWLQRTTNRRNQGLLRTHAVSQQVADNSQGAMLQAEATYRQMLAMQSYEVIKAPFDGIVTERYFDAGALIAQTITPAQSELLSHMSLTATPLLMLASMRALRVYASVPQNFANSIHDGDPARVTVEHYPDRSFNGSISRHPQALDPVTRMMLIEVDLPNAEDQIYPGMYGMISLTVRLTESVPLVPDDALIFRQGKVFVPVVRSSIVHLAPVSLGYDNGYAVEARGISVGDLIALNLGQSAIEGERVQPFFKKQAP